MDFAAARRKMVDNQVRPNGVTDERLLAAMLAVPRERFVPSGRADLAYMDGDLPVAPSSKGRPERCLIKPMVLARLIQALDLSENDQVLDVACATGYSTAVLARLGGRVVGIEDNEELAAAAERNLRSSGIDNASAVSGALEVGWPGAAPYDAILINGAVEAVPAVLFAQLREGGRLVAVVGTGPVGQATLFRCFGGEASGVAVFDAAVPRLSSFSKPPAFVF